MCRLIRQGLSTFFGLEVPLHTNTMYSFIILIKDLTNGGDVLSYVVRHLPKSPPKPAPTCCPARHPSRACTCPTTRPTPTSPPSTRSGKCFLHRHPRTVAGVCGGGVKSTRQN
jgi:hypothetical protein